MNASKNVGSGSAVSDVNDVAAKAKRQTTLVVLAGGKGFAQLSAHLESIDLTASVFYSRLRVASQEPNFVSPFSAMGPGLQSIDAGHEFFAESEGGGRSAKFLCIFADGRVEQCDESQLQATKSTAGFVTCVRVSGRWCLESETMSEKYPELKRKKDEQLAAETSAT